MAGRKVRVLYDFDGEESSGELTVSSDEILSVTRTDVGEGWWEGVNASGKLGLFPEAYVEFIDNGLAVPPPLPSYNQSASRAVRQTSEDQDGWDDDDWDDETASSYSGGSRDIHPSTAGHRPKSHSINRTGTVRKSINRFTPFVKSGGEAFVLGNTDGDVTIPQLEKIQILESDDNVVWNRNGYPFTCSVQQPEKKSKFKGMKSFISYNVTPSNTGVAVSRRFKHFDWLYSRLLEKFTCINVPPLPEKQITACTLPVILTSVSKPANSLGYRELWEPIRACENGYCLLGRFGEEFIEKRREKLEMWISRICRHPVLSTSSVFQHFILSPSDGDKEWKAGKRKAENDKLVGASFFLTIETPDQKLPLASVENRMEEFGKCIKSMDESVKCIIERSQIHCEKCQGSYKNEYKKVGATFTNLGTSFAIDEYSQNSAKLTKAVEHTGSTYNEIGEMFAEQPKNDFVPLIEKLKEYSGLTTTYPEVLQVHKGAIGKLKDCQKLKEEDKMEDETLGIVSERADIITNVSFAERSHFHNERVIDFKEMMKNFIQEQISFHQRVINKLQESLETYDSVQ